LHRGVQRLHDVRPPASQPFVLARNTVEDALDVANLRPGGTTVRRFDQSARPVAVSLVNRLFLANPLDCKAAQRKRFRGRNNRTRLVQHEQRRLEERHAL
jgi:hypothetical protein